MSCLTEFLKTKKRMIFWITFAAILQVFGTLLVPFFVAEIIDTGIAQKDETAILWLGLKMLGAAGLTAVVSLWGSYLCADLSALTGQYLRERLFDKTQLLSIKDFSHFGTASMITRATADISIIQQTQIMFTQMILPTPLISVAAIIMTAAVNPALVPIPLISMAVFLFTSFLLFKKASPISKTIQRHIDTINRIVRESIVGMRVIRAFDNTDYERRRSDGAFSEYAENVIRLNRIFAAFNPVVWTVMGIAMAAVVWFGGYQVLNGVIEVGSITAVSEYTILMLVYLMMAAMVLVMMPKMVVSMERIQEVLDAVPEIEDGVLSGDSGQKERDEIQEKVVFKNVTFSYKGAEAPVLEDLSFTCEKGKTTAIIGGTGSGKSTAAGLILRLYDIQKGQILLEGEDIRTMTQHELRERVSYVPQKAFLFSGTIADNLRMGKKDASMEELRRGAEIAQAHSFISSLDEDYGTHVSQGGNNFSGGQKQRLCIARALVKKAPVYIFDDSFSALDFKTDAALRFQLKQEIKDSAVIIIAQRISTIMDADQIIVLDGGKTAGIGTHRELMETCTIYKEIADSQLTEKEADQYGKLR
ncbi:MAG: ABC transporter ATP-binding protein [Lacrimispora sp.]